MGIGLERACFFGLVGVWVVGKKQLAFRIINFHSPGQLKIDHS